MQQKLKSLLNENEELRGIREQTAVEHDQEQQAQSQLVAELRANLKTLEVNR